MEKLSLLSKKILFWLVLVLLAFIPLYPKFPLLSVSGTFVAIRAEDILIAFTTFIWLFYLITNGLLLKLSQDKIIKALGIFFFIGAVSMFSARFITHSISYNLAILHYLRRVEYMILLPIIFTAVGTKKQLQKCLLLLGGVTIIVDIYALGQKYLHFPVISTTNSEFSKGLILYLTPEARVSSTFAGHYDLAIFLSMVLIASAGLFFLIGKRWLRLGVFVTCVLSAIVLIMTAARVSFIAAVVGSTIYLVFAGKRLVVLFLIAVVGLILIYPSQLRDRLVSTITVNLEKQGERYSGSTTLQKQRSNFNIPTLVTKTGSSSGAFESTDLATAPDIVPGEPVDTTELGVYRSFGIRLNYEWPTAIHAFQKNPFLGTGYSSLGIATDNDFLRSLGEVGLLGTLAFFLVILTIVKTFWQNFKSSDRFVRYISALGLVTVLGFLINASFIDAFEASKVATIFWMVLGLCLTVMKTT